MLSPSLGVVTYGEYLTTLARGYELKVTVQILTLEHDVVSTVSHVLMDGQVDVAIPYRSGGEIPVSRVALLTFLDPGRSLALDSNSPADGALYLDRMLRITYSVRCPSGWVDVPVFTGPVTKVNRDGDMVDVEAQGKERLALSTAWVTGTESGRKTDVVANLMKRTGEIDRYMDIPASSSKVTKPVSIGRETRIWEQAWRVNSSLNRILYYDGRGVLRSTRRPSKTAIVVRTGNDGMVLSDPQIAYSTEGLVNAVRVIGGRPSSSKPAVSAPAYPDRSHTLSPWSLARRGKPQWLGLVEENADLKSTTACRARANDLLEDSLLQHVDTTLDCLPIPHLEAWDIVRVTTPYFSTRVLPKSFSLPLVQRSGAGTPMSLGFTHNLRKLRRRIGRP